MLFSQHHPAPYSPEFQQYANWRRRRAPLAELDKALGNRQGWLLARQRLQPGDEFWFFNSSPESWHALAGRQGYLIWRNGQVADAFITLIN